jgi:hypothetical protein
VHTGLMLIANPVCPLTTNNVVKETKKEKGMLGGYSQ